MNLYDETVLILTHNVTSGKKNLSVITELFCSSSYYWYYINATRKIQRTRTEVSRISLELRNVNNITHHDMS